MTSRHTILLKLPSNTTVAFSTIASINLNSLRRLSLSCPTLTQSTVWIRPRCSQFSHLTIPNASNRCSSGTTCKTVRTPSIRVTQPCSTTSARISTTAVWTGLIDIGLTRDSRKRHQETSTRASIRPGSSRRRSTQWSPCWWMLMRRSKTWGSR